MCIRDSVYSQRLNARLGLAFAAARLRLTSPLRITSRLIMQKARGQAFRTEVRHSPPTACRHTVSGTVSLPSQGCFSPFPHGTGSLSVAREYLALRDGPRRFPRYSGTCPASQRIAVYRAVTVYGRPFQTFQLIHWFLTRRPYGLTGPTTP